MGDDGFMFVHKGCLKFRLILYVKVLKGLSVSGKKIKIKNRMSNLLSGVLRITIEVLAYLHFTLTNLGGNLLHYHDSRISGFGVITKYVAR
jgi:hypothetical protein